MNRGFCRSLCISATAALLAGCGGSQPPIAAQGAMPYSLATNPTTSAPADTNSILKRLKKNVLIGKSVDPTNGDRGPYGLAIVQRGDHLKKGQVLVCNFSDSSGNAGQGTTIDVFDPSPSSIPRTFANTQQIRGCDGVAVTRVDTVFASALSSGLLVAFGTDGRVTGTIGAPLVAPSGALNAPGERAYSPNLIFASDANTGSIVNFSTNSYGNPNPTEVVTGFDVNGKSNWGALGPSGLSYDLHKDRLYVADGVDSVVVAITNASMLGTKDEIVVRHGGAGFRCSYPKLVCGKLIYKGPPLAAPVAMTILPNGNIIVANTSGGNRLVELTPVGQILATKIVDRRKAAGIFGLAATGTNDGNTALFYTDRNINELRALEQ